MIEDIYVKINNDEEMESFKLLLKDFNINYFIVDDEKKFFPIAVDFKTKKAYSINSASICSCLFINAKKKLINLFNFKKLIKEI